MGYHTSFNGRAKLWPYCPDGMIDFVNHLSGTRRMKRRVDSKYGTEGEYYVLGSGMCGQGEESNITHYNDSPSTQPGLWCQWIIKQERFPQRMSIGGQETIVTNNYLQWDGGEKFYDYVEWLDYLIARVFDPYEIKLMGDISWEGEDTDDVGEIHLFVTDRGEQIMEADGHGHYPYLVGKSMPKLDFLDLLNVKSKDKQGEFEF
jgi:hypothetical protein